MWVSGDIMSGCRYACTILRIYKSMNMRNEVPLISIVLPTFNRAKILQRAIDSVIEQSFAQWELIIVDNNSNDETDQVIERYGDSRINILKINNEGVIARSRNKGIKKAAGRYVAFLDSDDWWTPNKLENSLIALESGADLVYHDLYIYRDKRLSLRNKLGTKTLKSPVFNDLLLSGKRINTSSVVMRRELLEEINGFSEDVDLVAAEDIDAWLRVAKKTEKFVRLVGCYGFYHIHTDNYTSNDKAIINIKRRLDIYQKDLKKLGCEIPVWANYSLGRAYYNKNDNGRLCRKYLLNVILHKQSSPVKVRAFVFLLLSIMKEALKKLSV